MGLFDQVVGDVLKDVGASPQVSNMLGGLLQSGGGQNAIGGGIGNLIAQFERAGLGDLVHSWIGKGENKPVSPQQVEQALGSDKVQDMAKQAGMPKEDLLSQLSQHLPKAVDAATPNGQVPDGGSITV